MHDKDKIRYNYRRRINYYRHKLHLYKTEEREEEPTFCNVCTYAKCRCEEETTELQKGEAEQT